MPAAEYTVRLDAFEGPLDLLLFLIRRAEVEISDIPIAKITEQYLKHIEELADPAGDIGGGRIDIERAGEFLVMAATLMEIKSRMLAPPAPTANPEGAEGSGAESREPAIDPREELVKQLLEYKQYRDAGDALNRHKRDWEDMFPSGRALAGKPEESRAAPEPEQAGPVDLEDIELIDLVRAFGRIIETVDLTRVGEHRVTMDDPPIELHAEDIVDRLRRRVQEALAAGTPDAAGEMEFASVFENRTKSEMIGLFLAVLELVKQQRVWVKQRDDDRSGKQIVLRRAEEAAGAPAPHATIDAPRP